MKSFEQFEYEKSLLDEASIVGANVGQRFQRNATTFQRGNTSSAQYSKEIGDGAKGPMNRREVKGPAKTSSQEKTTEKVKVLGTSAGNVGVSPKAPSIPTRPGRRSDGSKKTGVAATIERNKARAKDLKEPKEPTPPTRRNASRGAKSNIRSFKELGSDEEEHVFEEEEVSRGMKRARYNPEVQTARALERKRGDDGSDDGSDDDDGGAPAPRRRR